MPLSQISMIAQELSQPVDSLGLLIHALGRHVHRDGEAEDILAEIEAALIQLRRKHWSLVDLLRAERGLVAIGQRAFPVAPVVQRIAFQIEPFVRLSGVALRLVPSRASVLSDPDLFAVIARNVVLNALFCAGEGRVLVGFRRRGRKLAFEVHDDGAGMSADRIESAFEAFVKLPQDGKFEGLGLGLTISRRIADALGHEISVRSVPGKGTVVSVLLPNAEASDT